MNAERIFRISREISRENFKFCVLPGKFPDFFFKSSTFSKTIPGRLVKDWNQDEEVNKNWLKNNMLTMYTCVFRPTHYLIRSMSDCKWCNNDEMRIYHLWWLLNIFSEIILCSFWCFCGTVKPPRSGPSETALRLRSFPRRGPAAGAFKKNLT